MRILLFNDLRYYTQLFVQGRPHASVPVHSLASTSSHITIITLQLSSTSIIHIEGLTSFGVELSNANFVGMGALRAPGGARAKKNPTQPELDGVR